MKTYRYRSHIRWLKPVGPILLILMAVWIAIPNRSWDLSPLLLAIAAGLLVEAWVIWNLFSRMARVEVSLGDAGVTYRGKKATIEMPFEEIQHFRYPSLPYLGGWLKIVSDTDTLRLTVVLENIGQFVRELKETLDRHELSSRYDRKKLFRFYKTAEYADQSWMRIYENLGKGFGILAVAAVIGWIVSTQLEILRPAFLSQLTWIGGAVLWALLIYLFAEIEMMRRISRDSDEASFMVPERDRQSERVVFRWVFGIGAVFFFAGVIAVWLFFR